MDLKILMLILIYYSMISLFFIYGASVFIDLSDPGGLSTAGLNETETGYTGGSFGSGISFARFAGLITVGIGLPVDTPSFFKIAFAAWQTLFLIFTVGWFINSIWSG